MDHAAVVLLTIDRLARSPALTVRGRSIKVARAGWAAELFESYGMPRAAACAV